MVLSLRSGQALVNSFLAALGIVPADATANQRATALAELQDAYTEVQRGVYFDERGARLHHLFSFLHPTSTALTVAAMAAATLTNQDIVYTAVDTDSGGNDVSVTIAAGAGALAVAESDDAVTVTLAVGGNTTAEVVAAINAAIAGGTVTVLTVAGGSATVATALAETHLSLAISGTACPSSFGGLLEPPRFGYDAQDSKDSQPITRVSPEDMDNLIRDWDGAADDPAYYCLRPKAQSASTGTLLEFVFFPPPEEALSVYIRYAVEPAALTDSATAYAAGNAGIEHLIVAVARANKETLLGQVQGPEWRRAMRVFADVVREDLELYPTESSQESVAEYDTGIS